MKKIFSCFFVLFIILFQSCGDISTRAEEETEDTNKLVFRNENSSSEGYQIFTVEEKRNHPLAGEPDFVYLIMEKEGVIVEGPTIDLSSVDDPDDIFQIDENGRIEYINLYEEYGYADGIRAVFNDRLRFDIPIDDYEFEIALESLSSITLTKNESSLSTSFVFLATGDGGVAHDITINALIDENIVSTADPVTIEVRAEEDSAE